MRAHVLRLHYKTAEKLIRLKKEAEEDGAYRVAKRLHAVILNSDGWTSGQIADVLKAPLSKVSEWLRRYEENGFEGLLEGERSGRPRELTEKQLITVTDIVDSGPVAYGFLSGVWTSPMVARVIEEEFGVSYHPGHVRKLLHQLGFSVQRPKRILVKADPQKRDRWRRRKYPNIKKSPD